MWEGFWGVRFATVGGKATSHEPKTRYIMLKSWNLVHKHRYVVSEIVSFSASTTLILLISAFFCKKSAVFGKNSTSTQSNSMKAVLEIF